MARETFFPGTGEPHLHIIKNSKVVFTDIGHSHKTLQDGSKVYSNVVRDLKRDLAAKSDSRYQQILHWIDENI